MPNYEITMRKSLKIFESWRFLGISKCTRITSTKTISFWMKFWFYSINFDIFPKWQKSYVRLTFRNFDPKSRRFSITTVVFKISGTVMWSVKVKMKWSGDFVRWKFQKVNGSNPTKDFWIFFLHKFRTFFQNSMNTKDR